MQIKKWFLNGCEHCIGAVVLKKQSTVETSVFCSEFVIMKQGIDALRCLRCMLRIMGVPISVPHIFKGTIYQLQIINQDQNQFKEEK